MKAESMAESERKNAFEICVGAWGSLVLADSRTRTVEGPRPGLSHSTRQGENGEASHVCITSAVSTGCQTSLRAAPLEPIQSSYSASWDPHGNQRTSAPRCSAASTRAVQQQAPMRTGSSGTLLQSRPRRNGCTPCLCIQRRVGPYWLRPCGRAEVSPGLAHDFGTT